jgi:alpha-beta hydrolase superfamily lysophospholipase
MGCGSSHSAGRWPLSTPLPAALSARRFISRTSGLLLAHASWQPPAGVAPRAIVYVVHGYAEHLGRYAAVVAALAARACSSTGWARCSDGTTSS